MSIVSRVLLRAAVVLAMALGIVVSAASPASAAIEILNRGIDPDPALPGGTATLTVDVAVGQAPYIVQFSCCGIVGGQSKFITENEPETQGLTGRHTFEFNVGFGGGAADRQVEVSVFDSSGAFATQRFEFSQPAVLPPAPEPVPDVATRTGQCPANVEFGLVKAKSARGGCWTQMVAGSSGYTNGNVPIRGRQVHYEGTAAFTLNGIPFPDAPAGSKYVIAEPSPDSPGGRLGFDSAVTVKLGQITVIDRPMLIDLPAAGANGEGSLNLEIPAGKLGGLDIGGAPPRGTGVKVIFRKRLGLYSTSFLVNVNLPSIFKPAPGTKPGTVSGATEITTNENGKVNFDGGRIETGNAAIGKLVVKSICFSYLSANVSTTFAACKPPSLNGAPALTCQPPRQQQERYDGGVQIQLPTKSKTELAAYGGIANGQFAYAGGFVDNAAIPLVQGVTLERIGFGVCVNPSLTLRGDAGLGFASGIVRGDVSVEYSELRNGNFFVEAKGFMRVADIPIGNGFVKVSSTGSVDFGVSGVMPLAGGFLILRGGVNGFVNVSPFAFNLQGKMQFCLNFGGIIPEQCANASATVSSLGAGGCLSVDTLFGKFGVSAFAFYKKPRIGRQNDWGFGCGFEDRVKVQRAIKAQAGSPLVFDVPEGDRYVVHATGADAAPKVRVSSPSGKTISSGEGPVTTDRETFLIIESAVDKETSVFLSKDAAPGNWKIEALPGSTITDISKQAEDDEPTVVAAKVSKQGDDRVVNMRAFIKRGEKVALSVVGRDYQQVVAANAAGKPCSRGIKAPGHSSGESRCARIKFTPTFGYGGKRTLQATITKEGAVVDTVKLATFTASSPRTPGKVPAVRIVRKGTDVFAIWGAGSKGTERYGSYVQLGDGRKVGHSAPKGCFAWRIPDVDRDTSVKLRVQAGRADLEFGREVTVSLQGGKDYAGPAAFRGKRVPKACESS